MSNIVIEIDGVRHVMRKKDNIIDCEVCSLNNACGEIIGYPCLKNDYIFTKE